MSERNYYILLEVTSTATFEEIKVAYRILAKKYHPDKNTGNKAAEEYFKEIQQAYSVLSNPEKRRKYDLKFSYSRPQYQQKNSGPAPQYTGNAYQYAQQQAQYQQQYQQATQSRAEKKQPEKTDNSESWQILVSVGIAMILLYFIISYSSEKAKETVAPKTVPESKIEQTDPGPTISNFESPYSGHFGEETGDPGSKNSITIINTNASEAVVCLTENKSGGRTIRNQYINMGSTFKMNEVPDGEYFLKVYFGNNWDPTKKHLNGLIKGGFKNERGFGKLNSGKEILKMKKVTTGASDSYSTYEITIDPSDADHMKSITEEDFFEK